MASKQIDAVSSFQHVVDNVPQWKTHISELATYAAGRHDEFVAEYSRLVHQVKARRKKSASVASIRSSDGEQQNPDEQNPDDAEEPLVSPRSSDLAGINPLEAGNRFIYAQAHKKRKPGTSMRSNQSGPRTHRSKQMVVIYYDSHIQTELDKLVKGFGAARNTLRKGKNAYTAAKGFALPSLSRRYENLDNLVPNMISRTHTRLSKASSEALVTATVHSGKGDEAFGTTDKELEQIQSLCETAAHQAIRDGDCKVELREAESKLDVLLAMAESALHMLKAEEDRAGEEAGVSEANSTQSTLCEKPSLEAMSKVHKILPPVIDHSESRTRPPLPITVSAPSAPLSTDAIEVDDDDDSSEDIDLNIASYRAAGRRLIV